MRTIPFSKVHGFFSLTDAVGSIVSLNIKRPSCTTPSEIVSTYVRDLGGGRASCASG